MPWPAPTRTAQAAGDLPVLLNMQQTGDSHAAQLQRPPRNWRCADLIVCANVAGEFLQCHLTMGGHRHLTFRQSLRSSLQLRVCLSRAALDGSLPANARLPLTRGSSEAWHRPVGLGMRPVHFQTKWFKTTLWPTRKKGCSHRESNSGLTRVKRVY